MKIELEIPKYLPQNGIEIRWEPEYEIRVGIDEEGAISIVANSDGVRTLAIHLLTLAQTEVPRGSHIHYDDYGGLESGSAELIIAKS